MRFLRFCTIIVLGAITGIATAEVTDASANGFTLVHEVTVDASRAEAWAAAVRDVGLWWNPDHTISGNAALLTIDARPLGRGTFDSSLPRAGAMGPLPSGAAGTRRHGPVYSVTCDLAGPNDCNFGLYCLRIRGEAR